MKLAKAERKAAKERHEQEIEAAETKSEIKRAEETATADRAWEARGQQQSGWKDEFFLVILSAPIIGVFIPPLRPYITDGFTALKTHVPDWWLWMWVTCFGSAYGVKKFVNFILKIIVPRLKICIHNLKEIKNIRSSIIISNHISYLDPLLILSTNKRLVTILRGKHIRIPVFGWLLNKAGYIPIAGEGRDNVDTLFIERVSKIKELFLKGQNILIKDRHILESVRQTIPHQ